MQSYTMVSMNLCGCRFGDAKGSEGIARVNRLSHFAVGSSATEWHTRIKVDRLCLTMHLSRKCRKSALTVFSVHISDLSICQMHMTAGFGYECFAVGLTTRILVSSPGKGIDQKTVSVVSLEEQSQCIAHVMLCNTGRNRRKIVIARETRPPSRVT